MVVYVIQNHFPRPKHEAMDDAAANHLYKFYSEFIVAEFAVMLPGLFNKG